MGKQKAFLGRASLHIKKQYIFILYNLQAGRPKNSIFFWTAFVTRLLTPRSRKSGYGLLLGCRSPLDHGPCEKTCFDKVRTQKPGKSSLSVLVHDRNRSHDRARSKLSRLQLQNIVRNRCKWGTSRCMPCPCPCPCSCPCPCLCPYSYQAHIFDGDIKPCDIGQGSLGDCYYTILYCTLYCTILYHTIRYDVRISCTILHQIVLW